MYKKKLGVRVVTAITVGSLLCSNASVAMAAEEVSSIIKEHSEDAEKTETPEEEVTETEEVVEETTEVETETETEVESETEAETESETDEEELENDFEEVELDSQLQMSPMSVDEPGEGATESEPYEKTVVIQFICDGESVGTSEYVTSQKSQTVISRKELLNLLGEAAPEYELVDKAEEWFTFTDTGYDTAELEVEVVKIEPEIPESLDVYYVDENGTDLLHTFWLNQDGGAFDEEDARYQFNVDANELSGYEFVSYELKDGKVTIHVKKAAPEIPESLDVYYVDENGADLLHTFWLNQDGGAFDEEDARYQFNVDAKELSGYEYVRYDICPHCESRLRAGETLPNIQASQKARPQRTKGATP